jgi:hypothetical protein
MRLYTAWLEWDGLTLYRVQGARRELIGTVLLTASEEWEVWLLSQNAGAFPTRREAQEFLERIA